jgi:hypothetical protein
VTAPDARPAQAGGARLSEALVHRKQLVRDLGDMACIGCRANTCPACKLAAEITNQLYVAEAERDHWKRVAGHVREQAEQQQARAEEAEAEAHNYAADYDRRGERLWRLAAKAGHVPCESDNDATAEMVVAAALDSDTALAAAYAEGRRDALAEAERRLPALTEGTDRAGTKTWQPHDREVYSLAIEEAQAALAALRAEADPGEVLGAEGVGTGAGEGAPRQDTGSAWVTRSADCPEAPAQAHPLRADPGEREAKP